MRETSRRPRLLVLVASLALAVATALATLALFAAEAQATARDSEVSVDSHPPKAVLMKSDTVLQKGIRLTTCWGYWAGAEHVWRGYCADYFSYYFPEADVVPAGTRLHVRIAKPERPSSLRFAAYPRVENVDPAHPKYGKYVKGHRQSLKYTFRRVERDEQTVAWDVFFRVNEPDRHYYLDFWPVWEKVPGTHASYGDVDYTFHVKTY